MVLVAIRDLFFSSKIDAAVSAGGEPPVRAKREVGLPEQVRELRPARLVVEIAAAGALDAIRAIKGDAELASTEIVGYCRHTAIDLIRAAKSAGADRVLTQGEFAELLPALLRGDALPKGEASCD